MAGDDASGETTPLGGGGLEETAPVAPPAEESPAAGMPHAGWDRYAVLAFLGEGGMGRVYRGFDPRLRRDVALKFLGGKQAALAGRFAREARLMARIDHPAICKVYEVGEVGGEPYIAMQLIQGVTLTAAQPSLSLGEKLDIMEEVA